MARDCRSDIPALTSQLGIKERRLNVYPRNPIGVEAAPSKHRANGDTVRTPCVEGLAFLLTGNLLEVTADDAQYLSRRASLG